LLWPILIGCQGELTSEFIAVLDAVDRDLVTVGRRVVP
jgi:hypothetical protein